MTVIVHPAHASVLADYAVFRIVKIFIAGINLLDNGFRNPFIIVMMQHALKSKAGMPFKVLEIVATENINSRPVGIYQFFRFRSLVYEKTAGHIQHSFVKYSIFFVKVQQKAACLRRLLFGQTSPMIDEDDWWVKTSYLISTTQPSGASTVPI